ncbi:S15/NS1 RNA-binding domain-containing protein [Ascobolus immersus RN42]|uniref:S15/NS1 RNA-binding domain-containing protein n=1 Tax=Ascobolus immersus RN42 TaxID=1160509 RepID=A0A3N4IAZ7_ASCIM|nr:S15/NS1 RNA-binding domain-containing protein [Ascobolus immersus RN42]
MIAQALKKKEANIARRRSLDSARESLIVDPILGRPTPFTAQLDSVPHPPPSFDRIAKLSPEDQAAVTQNLASQPQNFYLTPQELTAALETSREITAPRSKSDTTPVDPQLLKDHEEAHRRATEAITRITSIGNGSSLERTRLKKSLCIDTFGRHNTDSTLPPDPAHAERFQKSLENKLPRAGPDTGSSEVQAAIFTAKIRALAAHMKVNKQDKMNRANLRELCHKRQKILRYLKKKERGGGRYRYVMEQLGLDDAAVERQLYM